jgi:hypothetical protein
VVFTRPDGSLASLRATDVDLAKSSEATAAANNKTAEPVAKPAAPPKPIALRLTDKDVGHVDDGGTPVAAKGEEGASGGKAAAPSENAVKIDGWEQQKDESGDGLVITGGIRNQGKTGANGITVDVALFGPDGKVLQITRAILGSESLGAGEKTTFRVDFPGVPSMTAVKFDVRSTNSMNEQAPPETEKPPGTGAR